MNVSSSDLGLRAHIGMGSLPVGLVLSRNTLGAIGENGERASAIGFDALIGPSVAEVDLDSALSFEISFSCRKAPGRLRKAFSVDYLYFPDGQPGKIRVPKRDGRRDEANASSLHALEGWYSVTADWVHIFRPMIADAIETWVKLSDRLYQYPPDVTGAVGS